MTSGFPLEKFVDLWSNEGDIEANPKKVQEILDMQLLQTIKI